MTYNIMYYKNGLRLLDRVAGDINAARRKACKIAMGEILKKKTSHSFTIYIQDTKRTGYNPNGELWITGYRICLYESLVDNGCIWKVNPTTGKLISKYGDVE